MIAKTIMRGVNNMEIGKTILKQIQSLDSWALLAWGSNSFVGGKVDGFNDGIKFKVKGSKVKRGTWLMITLNTCDLYDIVAFRVLKGSVKYDAREEGVYAEDLVRNINSIVG
jgi:hypothetical protein